MHTSKLSVVALFAVAAAACSGGTPLPKWAVSPPAELCSQPELEPGDFCMPSAEIERWFQDGQYTVVDAAVSPTGMTAPYKLRLQLPDGRTFSAKFKRAPDELEGFNNSPRREVAAYEIQKMFLAADEYVVPPTTLVCMPIEPNRQLMPTLEPHEGADCAVGILAYWVEGLTLEDDVDERAFAVDPAYRDNFGKLNILTILIGHQDDMGKNVYRAKDPDRPRLVAVDNGLSMGAMGVNPIQIFSEAWSRPRVDVLPARTVARLKEITPASLEKLAVVAQLEKRDGTYVRVPATEPIDPEAGVRQKGDVVQLGLTVDEIEDVHERLMELLADVATGEVRQGGPASGR